MTTLYLADTHLIDRSKENKPSIHKVYFLEDPDNIWKNGEIAAMSSDLRRSKLLERSQYGIFVCNSDIDEGYSNLFDLNPNKYCLNWPLSIRNINLETPKLQERRGPLATGSQRMPPINLAEILIGNFELELLIEQGPEAFKEEYYPETVFHLSKPSKSKR